MLNCYPAWSKKTLTFQQLEDLLTLWYSETEDAERIFHNMIEEMVATDKNIKASQDKCKNLMQTYVELEASQRILDCQVYDLCCDLCPLEDMICCLESLTCCPPYVDCQKLCLYNMIDEVFVKVNHLQVQAEELAVLLETQRIMHRITTILSIDLKFLDGLLVKIGQVENVLLRVSTQHQVFASTPLVTRLAPAPPVGQELYHRNTSHC